MFEDVLSMNMAFINKRILFWYTILICMLFLLYTCLQCEPLLDLGYSFHYIMDLKNMSHMLQSYLVHFSIKNICYEDQRQVGE